MYYPHSFFLVDILKEELNKYINNRYRITKNSMPTGTKH